MAGPFFMVAALLVLSGAAKVVAPDAARQAWATIGVRVPLTVARGIGAAEMVLGCAGIVVGGPIPAGLTAVAFFVFALVNEALRRRDASLASCGCFGRADTPPTKLHTALNLGAAAIAAIATITPVQDIVTVMSGQPVAGLPFLALVGVGTYVLYLAFTVLSEVFAVSPSR